MKKFCLTLSLVLACTAVTKAQSRLSYSILVNESYSRDNYHQVCIGQGAFTILPAGSPSQPTIPPLCLDKAWKTNVTLNTNYKVNPRLRLQVGLGFNVMHLDKSNGVLGNARYKVEYLSIPVRAHYIINQGKVGFYIGTGLRTDIRLNDNISYSSGDPVADNARSRGVSFDVLVGVEVPLLPKLKLHFEPTYTGAITSYTKHLGFPIKSTGSMGPGPYELMPNHPSRAGISFGLTVGF